VRYSGVLPDEHQTAPPDSPNIEQAGPGFVLRAALAIARSRYLPNDLIISI
jgi:hypothetical protein